MLVRDATPADLPALLDIYNEAVANTTASWDHDPWSAVRHADWYAHKVESGFPILVADEDGEVLGYATYGEFHAKIGYAATREHSVYLRPQSRGRGVGRTLMLALIDRARSRGVHTLIGELSADNEASLRLHAGLGFVEVGRLREVGRKFGRWLDLVLVQLMLQD
jgi:phosphinothricin acetyltransferase